MATVAAALKVRREISKAAGRRISKRKIPRKRDPAAARIKYQAHLTKMRKTLAQLVREDVIPTLPELVAQGNVDRGSVRTDSATDQVIKMFSGLRVQFATTHPATETEIVTTGVGADVNSHNSLGHQRQMKAALGIELIQPEPFVQAQLGAFVKDNVDLVTGLFDGEMAQLEAIVSRGLRSGLRVESIRDELIARLGITKSKASLIARDQTLKLSGELTELRQRNVGIEEYTWDTSKDERVRPMHQQLDGTTQRWDSPPVVSATKRGQRRAHPHGDYSCRCEAIPILPPELLQ